MKTLTKNKKILNILFLILIVSENLFAGDPPPVGGDPTGDPGATPIGGSAPVGDGSLILLITVLLYISYKYYYQYINSIKKNKI
jgi:hypothetical protein